MKDKWGRTIDYLRLSLTDRCNLRCRYCMPDGVEKLEREAVLTYEEFLRLVALLAQCGKVGGNLNQLARHFNSGGADTEQLRAKILDELADLTAFRLHAEKVLGELYGNAQAYRL